MKIDSKLVIVLILLSTLLWSCGGIEEDKSETDIKANVEIGNPLFKSLTEYLTLNGNTIFLKKEIVRATFQGYIQKAYKTIGDKVSEGEPLFIIKTKEASAVDTSRINLGASLFNGDITINAKSGGVITQINYNAGDYVSDGEQIAVISNPSSLKIILNVPYQNISAIHLNSSCMIQLPDGTKFNGVVSKKIPNVDLTAQTQSFLVDVPVKTSLPENLNVILKIPLKVYNNSAVLPKSAIMSSDVLDEFWIMKLINDSTAVKVEIEKGIEDGDIIQILFPKLNSNDKIVTVGAYGLPDTANVRVGK